MAIIYGKLTAADPDDFDRLVAAERANPNNVYGKLTLDLPLAEIAAPLVETPVGTDYTIDQLKEVIDADPSLAEKLALTEVARPQGMRKGALTYFTTLPLSPDTMMLVLAALDELGKIK